MTLPPSAGGVKVEDGRFVFFLELKLLVQNRFSMLTLGLWVLLALSIAITAPQYLNGNVMGRVDAWERGWKFFRKEKDFQKMAKRKKESFRATYGLSQKEIDEKIGEKSVDVFPWDISLPWAYNLDWQPRPVFQSYTVYEARLDHLNRDFFLSSQAPKAVLFGFRAIDDRHPLFQEPSTLRSLLSHYRWEGKIGDYNLLLRNSQMEKKWGPLEKVGEERVKWGEKFSPPSHSMGYLFARVEIERNVMGRVKTLLYKAFPVFLHVAFPDGKEKRYRVIPEVLQNGILLHPFVREKDQLEKLFRRELRRPTSPMAFQVEGEIFYHRQIKIEYWAMPFSRGREK